MAAVAADQAVESPEGGSYEFLDILYFYREIRVDNFGNS